MTGADVTGAKATGSKAIGAGKEPAASLSVFLEHHSYRRRRLMDAARLLPLLGALLFALPLLWPGPKTDATDGGVATVAMSGAIIYIFAVWAVLIIASVAFGIGVKYWAQSDSSSETGQD